MPLTETGRRLALRRRCDDCGAEPGEECRPMCIGQAAAADAAEILLCDRCWEAGTGLLAECQDVCDLDLDHAGECAPYPMPGPEACQRCGNRDRLTRITASDLDYSAA